MVTSIPKKAFKLWQLFFCGICMGAADLVPGISGGTVAFIMGFYEQLLESIKTINISSFKLLLKGNFKFFFTQVAWPFLLTLGSGILVAFALLARVFHTLLENEIYRTYLYSAFFGLILASFWFCIRLIKEWKTQNVVGLILGAVIAYFLTESSFVEKENGKFAVEMRFDHSLPLLDNYDPSQHLLTHLSEATLGAMLAKEIIQPQSLVYDSQGTVLGQAKEIVMPYQGNRINGWLIFCGAIAICALLLPGISGSYLLTLMGVYPLIIGALADFLASLHRLSFDQDAFYVLFSLFIGIIAGVIIFARFVSWLLHRFPNLSIAVLSGFMIGAIRSIWPFWTYAYTLSPLKLEKGPQLLPLKSIWPSLISNQFYFSLIFAIGAFFLVFLMEYLAKAKNTISISNQIEISN